jgi:AhpD family alkylhydroperoxidase
MTRSLTILSVLGLTLAPGQVRAEGAADAARADVKKTLGFVPEFVKAIPDVWLPGLWSEVKNFQNNPKTALSIKEKELIGLAVAAQAGNRATVYSYTRCARANGATAAEIGEAVAIGSLVRRYSTFFNGVQLDEANFRAEIARLVEGAKAAAGKPPGPAPKPIAVVDARSAQESIKQAFGFVPEFMKKIPPDAAAGAWLQMRDIEMSPTALPGKTKTLISLAVSAQVPCRYCVVADTEFARLEGASEQELSEAVTMAGIARSFGAMIDGLQVDEATFRRDFDRMTPNVGQVTDKGGVARKSR